MKNVAFKLVGHVLVAVYGKEAPSDAEAQQMVACFKDALRLENLRSLSYTPGGGPTAAQRKALNEVMAGRSVPAAVVTGSPLVRGLVVAVSWFNKGIRPFAPADEESAFRYLEIPSSQFRLYRGEVKKLEMELRGESEPISTGFKKEAS
jgi:hypothetical protein